MKLKDLAGILYSDRGEIQMANVYDCELHLDLDECSVDHAVEYWGECNIDRIQAEKDHLILHIYR